MAVATSDSATDRPSSRRRRDRGKLQEWTTGYLFVLPAGLVALCWHRIRRTHRATRVFQFAMVLLIASGFVGLWFHASRNLGFAAEMDPSAAGWTILRESLTGPTPSLAPGTIIHFGLLGLLYTYRHPWLRTRAAAARPRNLPSRSAAPSC